MTLDEDDIYVQKDAFSSLYIEAEKNNLDIIGFASIVPWSKNKRYMPNYSIKKRIIYQPELSNLMYRLTPSGKVQQSEGNLWNHFFRTDLPIY